MFNIPPTFYVSPDIISAPIYIEEQIRARFHIIESMQSGDIMAPKKSENQSNENGSNRFIGDLMSFFHTNYDDIISS